MNSIALLNLSVSSENVRTMPFSQGYSSYYLSIELQNFCLASLQIFCYQQFSVSSHIICTKYARVINHFFQTMNLPTYDVDLMTPLSWSEMSSSSCSSSSSAMLEPFVHQVSGHYPMVRLNVDTVCKPLNQREHGFYSSIPTQLAKFTAGFYGVMKLETKEDEEGYICIKGMPPQDYEDKVSSWYSFSFLSIQGAPKLRRLFNKMAGAPKLLEVWQFLGHFWKFILFWHIIDGKNRQIWDKKGVKKSFS